MKATKETGTVRSWSGTFGFIERDDNGAGLFVYHSDIEMEGYRVLEPGQRVQFEIGTSERGPKAVKVQIIE